TARIFLAEQVNNKQTHSLGKGGKVGNVGGGEGGTINQHPEAMAANIALQSAADDIAAKIIGKAAQLPARSGATSSVRQTHSPAADSTPAAGEPAAAPTSLTGRSLDAIALKIGRIDGAKIYITGGENAGLKINDYLEVRHVTGTMKDDQGNDIETDERVEKLGAAQNERAQPVRIGTPPVSPRPLITLPTTTVPDPPAVAPPTSEVTPPVTPPADIPPVAPPVRRAPDTSTPTYPPHAPPMRP